MKKIEFYKSQSITSHEVESLTLNFETIFPDKPFAETPAIHELEADQLETALVNILPGGTYDRLLTKMLKRKHSQLIVKHEVNI